MNIFYIIGGVVVALAVIGIILTLPSVVAIYQDKQDVSRFERRANAI